MRTLLSIMMLIALLGCSDDAQVKLDKLKDINNTLEHELSQCKANKVNDITYDVFKTEPTPETPTCETISYDVLYQDGRELDTCVSEDVVKAECGIMAANCDSGYNYGCLKEVKYKTIEKEKCE